MNEREDIEPGIYPDYLELLEDLENESPITNIVLQIEIMAALGGWWKEGEGRKSH
jgi:hypothetical protein